MEYIFQLPSQAYLQINALAMQEMKVFIQDKFDKTEAGGVLLGRFLLYSNDVIVDVISKPQKEDKRERFLFKRDEQKHQKIINNVWVESQGTCNYLGEWHTHPQYYPIPSSVDLKGWKQKMQVDKFSGDFLYFIIVGIKETCLWVGNKRNLSIIKAKRIFH